MRDEVIFGHHTNFNFNFKMTSFQLESKFNFEIFSLDPLILFLPFASLSLSLPLLPPFSAAYCHCHLQLPATIVDYNLIPLFSKFPSLLSALYHSYYLEISRECFEAQLSILGYYAFYRYVELYNAQDLGYLSSPCYVFQEDYKFV